MDGLTWLTELTAWAKREQAETQRVLAKAGDADPVAKSHNGHGSPIVNRALIKGAQRRRGWTGLAASRAPSPPPVPPETPPTLGEIMRESDQRYEAGKRLLAEHGKDADE